MNGIYILGISAFYHESAACLLKDGKIIAAAQDEVLRVKNTIMCSYQTLYSKYIKINTKIN